MNVEEQGNLVEAYYVFHSAHDKDYDTPMFDI